MSLRGVPRHIKQRLILALVATTLLLSVSMAGIWSATSFAATSTGPAQGIQVSPVIINLNAEKGQQYKLNLTVTNVTAGTLVLTSQVNDFKAQNETGQPEVIFNNNSPAGTYSLRDWIQPIAPITLGPSQSSTVAFYVNVPADAEAGGHYGVVRFSGAPPAAQPSSVALTASVGTLILARVAGNINESLAVKQFFTEQNGHQSGIFANGPVDIATRIQNNGNVHEAPVGNITVKNTWGKTVATYGFGSPSKNVLPGSIRRYDQTFDKSRLFGRYTASLDAAYGTTGGVLLATTTFWVIPWKLILFLIIIVALIVVLTRRGMRRHDARVVRKHAKKVE